VDAYLAFTSGERFWGVSADARRIPLSMLAKDITVALQDHLRMTESPVHHSNHAGRRLADGVNGAVLRRAFGEKEEGGELLRGYTRPAIGQ